MTKQIWTIDSFTPSDGSKFAGVKVDHQAWLMRSGDKPVAYIALNLASNAVDETEARRILQAMVDGLNTMEKNNA